MNADFYIGLGSTARWLGTATGVGAPSDVARFGLFNDHGDPKADYAEEDFVDIAREIVTAAMDTDDQEGWWADSGDAWPWPYPTSAATDYTYAWNNGCIHVFEDGYLLAQHYPNGARRPSTFPVLASREWDLNPGEVRS